MEALLLFTIKSIGYQIGNYSPTFATYHIFSKPIKEMDTPRFQHFILQFLDRQLPPVKSICFFYTYCDLGGIAPMTQVHEPVLSLKKTGVLSHTKTYNGDCFPEEEKSTNKSAYRQPKENINSDVQLQLSPLCPRLLVFSCSQVSPAHTC